MSGIKIRFLLLILISLNIVTLAYNIFSISDINRKIYISFEDENDVLVFGFMILEFISEVNIGITPQVQSGGPYSIYFDQIKITDVYSFPLNTYQQNYTIQLFVPPFNSIINSILYKRYYSQIDNVVSNLIYSWDLDTKQKISYYSIVFETDLPFITLSSRNISTNNGYNFQFKSFSTNSISKSLVLYRLNAPSTSPIISLIEFPISINSITQQFTMDYYPDGSQYEISNLEYFPKYSNPVDIQNLYAFVSTTKKEEILRLEFRYNDGKMRDATFPVYGDGISNNTYLFWNTLVYGGNTLTLSSYFSGSPKILNSSTISPTFSVPPLNPSNLAATTNYGIINELPNILLIEVLLNSETLKPTTFPFFFDLNIYIYKPFPYGYRSANPIGSKQVCEKFTSRTENSNWVLNYYSANNILQASGDINSYYTPGTNTLSVYDAWFTYDENNYRTIHIVLNDYSIGFIAYLYQISGSNIEIFASYKSNGGLVDGHYQYSYLFDEKPELNVVNYFLVVVRGASGLDDATNGPIYDLQYLADRNIINFTPHNFTSFYFSTNNVNLNGLENSNSLFFTIPYPKSTYGVLFIPMFSLTQPTVKYYGNYDKVTGVYRIDFKIPKSLVGNRDIPYRLIISDAPPIESYELIPIYGSNSTLTVFNSKEFADEMPPIVTSISPYPSPIVHLTPTNIYPVTVGLTIVVEDKINGLKNGTITLKSLNDLRGYKFFIKPENAINGNQFIGTYNLYFNISYCMLEQYTITEIELWDNDNYFSIKNDDSQSFHIDPLMQFYNINGNLPSISITCDNPISNNSPQPPTLSNLTLSQSSINFRSLYRMITVYIDLKQYSFKSEKDTPIIYFQTVNDLDYESCESTLVNKVNGSYYQYECNHEFKKGFGSGFPITLSIYGLTDSTFKYTGYSSNDLRQLVILGPVQYYIKNYQSTISNPPIIEYIFPIKSNEVILTISGSNFYITNSSKIEIDYSNDNQGYISTAVNKILSQTPDYIIIEFDFPSFYSFNIRISINNSMLSNEYLVLPIQIATPTPPASERQCNNNNDCSNNGICLEHNGICKCNGEWTSKDCSSKIIIIPIPTPNNTNPTVPIGYQEDIPGEGTISIDSLISIQSINELDYQGNTINAMVFNKWNYKSIEINSTKQFQYNSSITKNNNITNINVVMEWFTKKTIINFANSDLEMNPSTIKYTISIDKYSFSSPLNHLQLVFKASIQDNSIYSKSSGETCSYKEFTGGPSDYIKLQVNSHSLYGRFIKRAIIDNQIKSVSTQVISNGEADTNRNDISSTLIAVKIPSFHQFAVIDPDFGLLTELKAASEKDGSSCSEISNKLSNSQIAGIAIAGFVFLASIIGTFIFYRKFKNQRLAEDKRIEMLVAKMLSNGEVKA